MTLFKVEPIFVANRKIKLSGDENENEIVSMSNRWKTHNLFTIFTYILPTNQQKRREQKNNNRQK